MSIIGIFSVLAIEAGDMASGLTEAAEEGGFGLNFDILETNLINLTIVIGLLFYFGRNLLGKTMTERRSGIEAAIQESEKRQKDAAAALADQQQKLAQAQTEAIRIREAADRNAKAAKEKILAQAEQDIQRLREAAAQDLSSQQERVITEVRQRIVAMAMEKAESQLREQVSDATQQQLVDQSIALLGGRS
ncbi:MAG: F0F1 ATP synthase subunit B [Cyanothece sp. SIO1E1]|nr:F0F1 ATP synthase subunit B [Cyanothece sp. SIO1E1]